MRLKPRQIESWFIALGLLDQRQKAWNDFDNHLRDILKDGSILCRLVNRIKPGSINQIYQSPVSDDQRLDNVHSFLNACQYLQLKENEIFSPTDLDSADGFQRVLRTLDCLENVATGYGLGKQFTKHHELTETDLTQDTEEESKEDKKLLEMTDYGGGIHLVKATFPFSGRDDDELCFERGDILEVTKVVDGGWWEGTLNGKVGWFPSNYVKEISASPEPTTPVTPQPSTLSASKRESVRVYHNLVVQNILDTERAHVSELQALLQNYLKPLQGSNVLPAQDMRVLAGNFEEIVQFQQMFFHIMDECAHLPLPQQRMGASYLQLAPQMKELYVNYCANHPRAVEVLTKYSDELSAFIESKGAPSPGILTLTTSLSKPFRHLDKYPNHMKELERHLEEGHVDELDTKKAIAVFQNLATSCHETRKRKETELEMLTGTIEGWEDEDISKQGDLYLMSQFLIHGENGEVRERSFLLFPNCLIILSVNANACGYCFEKKYDISELTVRSLEDSEGILNAFEIKVNEDVMKLSTNHAHEKVSWLEALQPSRQSQRIRQHSPHSDKGSVTSPSPWVERQPVSMSERMFSKSSPPRSYSTGSPPSSATPKSSLSTSGVHSQSSSEGSKFRSMSASHSVNTDLTAMSSAPQSPHRKGHWDFTRLRPTPPLRPAYALIAKEDTSTAHRSMRGLLHPSRKKQGRSKSELDDDKHSTSGSSRVLEEDMLILRVVEAYCTSARARHTVNSSPILPELPSHRPSSFSSLKGDVWKRKSKKKFSRDVAGEFNCLRRRVEELQLETESLKQSLLEEQRARKKMEKFIRCSLKGVIPDFKWDDIDDS